MQYNKPAHYAIFVNAAAGYFSLKGLTCISVPGSLTWQRRAKGSGGLCICNLYSL